MKILINIIFFISIVLLGFSQKNNPLPKRREIMLTDKDSIVIAHVLNKNKIIKTKENRTYYWFNNDKVFHNKGGYSGKVLDGNYQVFNKNRSLLLQGSLKKGLKAGKWIRWNEKGIQIQICFYKNGMKNGLFKQFDAQGNIIKILSFKKDFLDGKSIIFKVDSNLIQHFSYKKGLRNGKTVFTDFTGEIIKKCYYKNGLLNGEYILYTPNDTIIKRFKMGEELVIPLKKPKEKIILPENKSETPTDKQKDKKKRKERKKKTDSNATNEE